MDEWHIGDPVDWGDGFMDAQNWGRRNVDDEENDSHNSQNTMERKRDEYSRKAWNLCNDLRYDDALHYIDMALNLDSMNAGNWNKKAIILDFMARYEEAEKCYDTSLGLSSSNLVFDNKARMLRYWAGNLIEESKKKPDGLATLYDAWEINRRAIDALPGDKSEEDIKNYFNQRDTIEFYIDYEKKYQKNVETINGYAKSELFTISGMQFYRIGINLSAGMALKLVREQENEFDRDAIAVYAKGEKIGYVANSEYTKYERTSSASELKNEIQSVAQAEYVVYLDRYADIQFAIGRLIK